MAFTKEQILETAHKENVQFVRFQFSDINGILKALTVPVSKLQDAIEHNLWFDGSSIEGFTRIQESDMYLKPDLDTFAIIPWTRGTDDVTARFICDVYRPDGRPFEGCPRQILKKQLARLENKGYKYYVGPELEFFLFERNEDGTLSPNIHDRAGYFDQAVDKGAFIRKAMVHAMQDFGLDIEALHHEVAEAQHEINFKYDDALKTADNAMTMKFVVKSIANLNDLHATFMAKPIAGINGSGMHVHQSIFEGEENAFFDETSGDKLSITAKKFMAGQLSHIKAMNAIINPTVNSYKRLVAGYEAPVYIAWGQTNRSALIRIPRYTEGREKATRFELRCPDPTANPYLAFAVMLAAGLDGIEKGMECPSAVEDDLFEKNVAEVKAMGIDVLPGSLAEALECLKKDEVIKSALGGHVTEAVLREKGAECDGYKVQVSEWEIEKYLEKF